MAERIRGHSVSTVAARGWGGISNGKLLALAQTEFDVFVTVDRNLAFQQHLPTFNIAVILIAAKSNRITDLTTFGRKNDAPRRGGFAGVRGSFLHIRTGSAHGAGVRS